MKQKCLFCQIVSKEIPATLVYEDERVVAFKDIKPQAPVHILIVPKLHIPKLLDLNQQHEDLIGNVFQVANKIATEQGVAEKGFRIVANCNPDAGQEVGHIHFHLLGGRKLGWPPG